jgi:predicted LPLAT superfamily acyltransferase
MEWQGKSRGGLWGYRFFIFILRKFGISFAYFFIRIIAIYYLFFSRKAFKAILFYFNTIIKYKRFKSFFKTYKNFILLGEVLVDKMASLFGYNNLFTYCFDGEENLKEIIDSNKGGLLIGAHIGNWEIASHQLNRFKGKINLLMLDAEKRKVDKLLSNVSVHYPENVNMIVVKDDFSHIYEVCKALQNKEIVCVHGDRFLKDSKTEIIKFLGKEAAFSTGPFILAAKFKVPVCYFYGMKEPRRHYHLYAFNSKIDTTLYSKNIPVDMLLEYTTNLEQIINKYPEQWFNYFQFWQEDLSK